jgi:hypothetical protein
MREAIQEFTGNEENDATIWSGLRRVSISKKIQQFLFKSMYSMQKIGTYWANIRENKHRQFCIECNATKSLEHILVECQETQTKMIWEWAKHYWPSKKYKWLNITLGIILGCRSINELIPNNEQTEHQHDQQDQQRSKNKGTCHLLQILLSETAHLIWVLRCE